jgi:hypothetical protein
VAATPKATLSLAQARSLWHRGQGLDTMGGDTLAALTATGPIRTLGGADVYISARARAAGLTRVELDGLAASRDVQVIPAARGCMYLVTRPEVSLFLAFAASGWRRRNARDFQKLACAEEEYERVQRAALAALGDGPLTPAALRKAMPEGVVRSFGALGKKVGMSSALPSALRELEFSGEVERTHEGGRLDTDRYLWGAATQPLAPVPEDILTQIAHRFFGFAGPATRDEFAAWSGAGKRDCAAAMANLDLVPVAIEGRGLAHMREAWLGDAPTSSAVRFLSYEDSYVTVHGGPGALTDPAHHGLLVPVWGYGKDMPLGQVKHMHLRPFFVGPELRGFWEFDPDAAEVVCAPLRPLDGDAQQVEEEAHLLGAFLREEVGHGLSFSLDTADAARARLSLLATL